MPNVNNPLSGGKKTEVTSVETALNTAIAGLTVNDASQAATLATLRKMRKMLDNLKVERNGSLPINTNVPTKVNEHLLKRREQFVDEESRIAAPNPGIFLPPNVAKELLAERQRNITDVLLSTYTDHVCETWDRELQKMDPLLIMRRAHDKPALSAVSRGLHPGLYHIIRQNENAPLSLFPVQGPDGEFVEPSEDVLERLRRMDAHNGRAQRLRVQLQREARLHEQRAKEIAHEELVDRVAEEWNALSRTQVSTSTDTPWAQNHQGTKRRG